MKNIPIRYIDTTSKESDFAKNFHIRDIQDLLTEGDMTQELHRHGFFYLLALNKGEGNHEIDFTSYQIGDNTLFFMRPGQVHQLLLKAESTGYMIEFRPDLFASPDKTTNQLLRKVSNINFYQSDTLKFSKTDTLLATIYQEFNDRKAGYEDVIKASMHILFIELARQNTKSSSPNVNSYIQERFEEFSELLEAHIATHKQVSQYAEMLNLSVYQLNAITRAMLGKTCSELINEHIILEAKRYLLATSNQINQIAFHLGYEDISYFIRFFKKHTGYSPDAFRNNFR